MDKQILFFSTPTCNKCRQLLPVIENIAKKYPDLLFRYVDQDKDGPALFEHYDVRAVPTVVFSKCGSPIDIYTDIAPISAYETSFRHLHENDGD